MTSQIENNALQSTAKPEKETRIVEEAVSSMPDVEALQKQIRDLKSDQINVLDEIDNTLSYAFFLIDKLLGEYECSEDNIPDYDAFHEIARNYQTVRPTWSGKAKIAEKWFFGYKDVWTLMSIARKYLFDTRKQIEAAGSTAKS